MDFHPHERHCAPLWRPSKQAEANSPDLKTPGLEQEGKPNRTDFRCPLPPCGVWPPGEEESSPGSSTPQAATVITTPPPSSSDVDTVAAVFRVDAAQTGTDAGIAAQLERRAGWRCL